MPVQHRWRKKAAQMIYLKLPKYSSSQKALTTKSGGGYRMVERKDYFYGRRGSRSLRWRIGNTARVGLFFDHHRCHAHPRPYAQSAHAYFTLPFHFPYNRSNHPRTRCPQRMPQCNGSAPRVHFLHVQT